MNLLEQLHYLNKIRIQVILACCVFTFAKGQDPVMSQIQITKNYINPAYAGYSNDLSLSLNSRLQWSRVDGVDGVFNTSHFAANIACQNAKMGLALYGYNNWEGNGFLRTTMAGVQGAFYSSFNDFSNGRKNLKSKSAFSAGLQIGLGQKKLDWEKLTFSDQLSTTNYQITRQNSIISPRNQNSNIIWDLATGFRILSSIKLNRKEGFWSFGASVYHLHKNEESFFGFGENLWPTRYVIHASFNHPWWQKKPSRLIDISLLMNRQSGNNTFTILTNYSFEQIFKGGLGLRTSTVKPNALILQYQMRLNNNSSSNDNNDWLVSYSYEYTLGYGSLNQAQTFGSHEIGIIFILKNSSICGNKFERCLGPTKQIRSESLWSL